MFPNPLRRLKQAGLGVGGGFDDEMAITIRQGDEIALRVNDRLLYPGRALFQEAAQQM